MHLKNITQEKLSINNKPLLYIIVGSFNTLFALCLFPILFLSFNEVHYNILISISALLSTLVSFSTQAYFVFRKLDSLFYKFYKFVLFQFFIYLVNIFSMFILIELLAFNILITQIILTIIIAMSSYFIYRDKIFT